MHTDTIREIEHLIINYFEGIFHGNITRLKNCFHKNATIYGDINGIAYSKNANEYIEDVKNRQSPKDLNETLNMKINGIDITGKIAMAKLHVPILGYNYYDYISLSKINNEWKIMNKIFIHIE